MKFLITLLLVLFSAGNASAVGTVQNVQFFSQSLGEERWVQVYLPEGYDPESPTQYPAIYFLHGANGNHLGYPELITYLDTMIAGGQISPVIAIKPDGSSCNWDPWWEGCGWVNSDLQGDFEDFLIQDLIPWAEQAYRIIPDPQERAIMGHSMGAFGAMHAALRHPEMFVAVAAHSGYPHFGELFNQHISLILSEQSGSPPWQYTPATFWTGAWFMFSGGFSPDLSNPPYFVDFPLDGQGARIPAVWDRWLEHDPATIAASLAPGSAPKIYFDCGTADEYRLFPVNAAFRAQLTALGVPYVFQPFNGGHWAPQRLQTGLSFLNTAFNAASSVGQPVRSGGSILDFWVQSPSDGKAGIGFELERRESTILEVFDVAGRLTSTLLHADLQHGTHRCGWNTNGVPAGVYYLRLRTGADRRTRPVVVQ